jgi:diadenosine tetraphosphate (Ap4A) HIT family hydrolase
MLEQYKMSQNPKGGSGSNGDNPKEENPLAMKEISFLDKIAADKIAEYEHWTVYLDLKQYYLGRVFVWAKRPEAIDMFELTTEEWAEFRSIAEDIKQMYAQTFTPDTLNVAFLGNDVPHCHCHIVPRYKTPRVIDGNTFIDENWGHNYSNTNTKNFTISENLRTHIRSTLTGTLNKIMQSSSRLKSVF